MNRNIILIVAILAAFSAGFVISCGEGDGLELDDGKLKGQVTLPLLPFDLPIFPTDVTLDGLVQSVADELDDLGMGWLFDNDDIEKFIVKVEDKLRDASLEILQPGVLSAAIDDQVSETFSSYVEVTQVAVNFEVANDTDSYVSVPGEFKLYLGNGNKAEDWDEDVMIPFADDRVEDGQFVIKPGETLNLSIDNVPHLVESLNQLESFGIGYKSLYRTADTDNDADVVGLWKEFGLCLVEGVISGSTSQCPSAKELLGWHLTAKKFELVIKAESALEIPEIPGCEEFADTFDLDLLKDACP